MMSQVLGLFQGQFMNAAIVLTVAAFVLGMIAMCLLCKVFCPCGKKKCAPSAQGQVGRKPPAKDRPPVREMKHHEPPADGSIEIYVGNLSYDTTEEQLGKEFAAFGKVNSTRIITNRYNGKSKGFGFVHMPNRAEADAAVAALNDKEIGGRKIKCNEAKN